MSSHILLFARITGNLLDLDNIKINPHAKTHHGKKWNLYLESRKGVRMVSEGLFTWSQATVQHLLFEANPLNTAVKDR